MLYYTCPSPQSLRFLSDAYIVVSQHRGMLQTGRTDRNISDLKLAQLRQADLIGRSG